MQRLDAGFFTQSPLECARGLIGCVFEWDGCTGQIVETEAYAAEGDPACHTFFRPSTRRFVADHPAGAAYVYLNYGVHWLFNVLVKGPTGQGFVLFRALDPQGGLPAMRQRRPGHPDDRLCAGPGKLTRAFGIDGASHGHAFLEESGRGIWRGESGTEIVCAARIGISAAKELPWRFGLAGSAAWSRKF